MNKLPLAKRVLILSMLVEGSSMRTISRIADVSINTVTKLLEDAGETCLALHDELVRGVKSERIQCDEIWSFCYAKAKNVKAAKAAPAEAGDVWTWTALDADTKLMITYFVGDRSGQSASYLADDLRMRVASDRVQLTTDSHNAYLGAIEDAFGADADYATIQKIYKTDPAAAAGRYSPPVCTGIKTTVIEGEPDMAHVSTSYVERSNLRPLRDLQAEPAVECKRRLQVVGDEIDLAEASPGHRRPPLSNTRPAWRGQAGPVKAARVKQLETFVWDTCPRWPWRRREERGSLWGGSQLCCFCCSLSAPASPRRRRSSIPTPKSSPGNSTKTSATGRTSAPIRIWRTS